MPPAQFCSRPQGEKRPPVEVADVFRLCGEAYRRSHALSQTQTRVMTAIEKCRTPALGGHLDECDSCGAVTPSYNSCRNRHCPKCQSVRQALWLERRMERLLPTHYFHVVFTVPGELHGIALQNRRFCNLVVGLRSRQDLAMAPAQGPKRQPGRAKVAPHGMAPPAA